MSDRLDLYFRAHTVPITAADQRKKKRRKRNDNKLPKDALFFRCVRTADQRQEFLLGAYVCAELVNGTYVAREIGLFYRPDHPEERRVVEHFVRNSVFEMGTLQEFRRKVFLKYLKAAALIVAYDAPIELSRIAAAWNRSRKRHRAFSLYFRVFKDKKTGKIRPSSFEPGISVESLDASKALFRLLKYELHSEDAKH